MAATNRPAIVEALLAADLPDGIEWLHDDDPLHLHPDPSGAHTHHFAYVAYLVQLDRSKLFADARIYYRPIRIKPWQPEGSVKAAVELVARHFAEQIANSTARSVAEGEVLEIEADDWLGWMS